MFLVYSPTLDQACCIARSLHKYIPEARIIGVRMKGERGSISRKYFPEVVPAESVYRKINEGFVHIPTGAVSTRFLLENLGDVRLGEIILTKEALRVFDKVWTLNLAKELGIPIPITWVDIEEVEKYPIFCKKRVEQGAGFRGVLVSPEDAKRKCKAKNEYIYQEWINSKGTYGVGFLAEGGRIIVTHTHFERESFPPQGGSAVIIEKFQDNRLIQYTERLINALNYSGWGLAEFKYCPRRNDYVLMEINAKFWASCEFSFVNEPAFLKLLFGIDSNEKPVDRMVFVNRAFYRGPGFIVRNIDVIRKSSWIFYPGWVKAIFVGIGGKLRP